MMGGNRLYDGMVILYIQNNLQCCRANLGMKRIRSAVLKSLDPFRRISCHRVLEVLPLKSWGDLANIVQSDA